MPGANLPEAREGITRRIGVDRDLLTGPQTVDIDAEDLLSTRIITNLESGLILLVRGEHDEQSAVERIIAEFGAEAHPKLDSRAFFRNLRAQSADARSEKCRGDR